MYITKQELENTKDDFHKYKVPSKFKSIKVIGVVILNRNQIVVDQNKSQIRKRDELHKRVDELQKSFDEIGVDYNEILPIVTKNSGNYVLESGFGRDALFDEVGQEYYAYTLVEISDKKEERSFRVYLNEPRPSSPNKKEDIIYNLVEAVQSKDIKKSEMNSWLRKVGSTRTSADETEIVESAKLLLGEKKSNRRYNSYTAQTFPKFINNSWSTKNRLSLNFEYKKVVNKCYGAFLLHTQVRDNISKAVNRFMDTGVKTLFAVCVRGQDITGRNKLEKCRKQVFKDIKKHTEFWDTFYKTKNKDWLKAFEVIGFIPQDSKENQGQLISPESYKI